MSKAFSRLVARAGLDRASAHTFRHRFATQVANNADNIRVGMAVTGHRSVAAFLGYTHADRDRARKTVDKVGAEIAALAGRTPTQKVIERFQPKSARALSLIGASSSGRSLL